MISIRVVRAVQDPDTANAYIDGHRKVLESYGVTKVTSANVEWRDDPQTYLIVAESPESGKVLGGGRIQVRSEQTLLPLEPAIAILDPRVYSYVNQIGNYNVAEFCGLWNSKEIAGYGVGSIILVQLGVAISTSVGISKLMALCSPATLQNSQRVGFEIVRELGNNGTLYYPKEDLVATALIIHDLDDLPSATIEDREKIFALRNSPVQEYEVSGPKGNLIMRLDLSVNNLVTV